MKPRKRQRETMRAYSYLDDEGQPMWMCSCESDKGDGVWLPVVELAANTFPEGTVISIQEPEQE